MVIKRKVIKTGWGGKIFFKKIHPPCNQSAKYSKTQPINQSSKKSIN